MGYTQISSPNLFVSTSSDRAHVCDVKAQYRNAEDLSNEQDGVLDGGTESEGKILQVFKRPSWMTDKEPR